MRGSATFAVGSVSAFLGREVRVQIEEHDQADAERGDRQDERLDVHPGGETEHSRGDHLERCKK